MPWRDPLDDLIGDMEAMLQKETAEANAVTTAGA